MRQNSLYDPRYRFIIHRLISARQSAGLSQDELATRIGVGQPEISKIEHFARKIELLELIDWIKATESALLLPLVAILEGGHGKN